MGAVYKGVHVNGADYEYFYDADGHRRFKSYPLGSGQYGDEFFWNGDALIEDRGLMPDPAAGYTSSQPRPLDEYVTSTAGRWCTSSPTSRAAPPTGPPT